MVIRKLPFVSLLLCCLAQTGAAQDDLTLTPDGMRQLATVFLAEGRNAEAADLADALLQRDPADLAALIVRARAAVAMRDFRTALDLSRRAYAAADTDAARFSAARLTALSHAELGQDTRAQFWLRRAGQYAPNDEAAQSVADDYRFVRQRNPLAISLTFGIAPSSNVNGGSASEILILPGLPFEFVLDGEARALSGVQFSGGINLSYRLRSTETSGTFLDGSVQGRTYILSAEAQDLAPDARGGDYSDISLTTSLSHRWLPEGSRGPWTISGTFGQTWYDNAPYLRFVQFAVAKGIRLDERNRLDLSAYVEGQDRISDDEQFPGLGGRARWTHLTGSGDKTTLTLSVRDSLTDLPDVGYQSVGLSVGYELDKPVMDLRIGFGADLEYQDYAESAYAFDGRHDVRSALRMTIGLPGIQYYGFEPLITLEMSQTQSDVDLFDKQDFRANIGVRSSF